MKVLIITPCGQEANIIEQHHKNLLNVLSVYEKDVTFDIAYIFDSYTDTDTRAILSNIIKKTYKTHTVHLLEKNVNKFTGLAGCYLQGYLFSIENRYDYVLEFDIESHEYSKIPYFINSALKGKKAIFGTRNKNKNNSSSSFKRKLISSLGTMLSNKFLGLELSDNTSGFQMFSTDVIKQINLFNFASTSYFFQTEIKHKVLSLIEKNEYEEVSFKYTNSTSSISYKNIFLSFIEFIYVFTHS